MRCTHRRTIDADTSCWTLRESHPYTTDSLSLKSRTSFPAISEGQQRRGSKIPMASSVEDLQPLRVPWSLELLGENVVARKNRHKTRLNRRGWRWWKLLRGFCQCSMGWNGPPVWWTGPLQHRKRMWCLPEREGSACVVWGGPCLQLLLRRPRSVDLFWPGWEVAVERHRLRRNRWGIVAGSDGNRSGKDTSVQYRLKFLTTFVCQAKWAVHLSVVLGNGGALWKIFLLKETTPCSVCQKQCLKRYPS